MSAPSAGCRCGKQRRQRLSGCQAELEAVRVDLASLRAALGPLVTAVETLLANMKPDVDGGITIIVTRDDVTTMAQAMGEAHHLA